MITMPRQTPKVSIPTSLMAGPLSGTKHWMVSSMEATAMPEATQQPETEHIEDTDTATDSVSNEAQTEDAQDEMYEGALAGMTDEEIAQQALAEEQNHGSETEGID